jgi:transcriptional regulator with XRE-family HTH domain
MATTPGAVVNYKQILQPDIFAPKPLVTLSTKIIELRKARGWSQQFLANALDVHKNIIISWEEGSYRPAKKKLNAMAVMFNVTVAYLIEK